MNEKEFLMEKINKAQIRKDEYLLRKSQKLKIDHVMGINIYLL